MRGRLLVKAAVLLAALMGRAAMANEPGTAITTSSTVESQRVSPLTTEQSALPDATVPFNMVPVRSTRVVIILDNSPKCLQDMERLRKPGGDFAAMQAQGWKIGPNPDSHIQWLDRTEAVELVKQLDASGFPVVACVSDGEIVRSFKDGCSTPLDAWTFGWLIKGVNERPQAAIPEAIRVATTGHYPLRGNHWSVDGDTNPTKESLVAHLRGPNHASLFDASLKIEDWSTEELRSMHDDLHEKYGPPPSATSSSARPTGLDQFSGNRKALGKF